MENQWIEEVDRLTSIVESDAFVLHGKDETICKLVAEGNRLRAERDALRARIKILEEAMELANKHMEDANRGLRQIITMMAAGEEREIAP
jgi:hypothetical protein